MKKLFLICSAAVMVFASCAQKELLETSNSGQAVVNSGSDRYVFNVTIQQEGTKAVKTKWEEGDKVFAFFDDATTKTAATVADVKYASFTYEEGSWVADSSNMPADSELSASGKVNAVFCPFGDKTISAADAAGTFYVSKSNAYYLTDTDVTYTKEGNYISFSLNLKLAATGLAQIFIPGEGLTNNNFTLSVYGDHNGKSGSSSSITSGFQRVFTAVFNPSSGTFSYVTNTIGKETTGYSYADGWVFYGLASLGESKTLVFELYDNTAKDWYVYTKTNVSKFSGEMAVKLPAVSEWKHITQSQVVLYHDGTLVINEAFKIADHITCARTHGFPTYLCNKITNGNYSGATANQPWASVADKVKYATFGQSFTPSSLQGFFFNCKALKSVDTKNLDTKNCTNLRAMFQNCTSLTSVDVSGFDTSKVTDMRSMFDGCNCKGFSTLDVSNWNVSKVTQLAYAFKNCSRFTVLDLSKWQVSGVVDYSEFLRGTGSVSVLDLSGFDTSAATNMQLMFYQSGAVTIYASDKFVTTSVTKSDKMFDQCSKLVGGNGTAFDSTKIDKTYARIDADGTPGYFTAKK